MIALLQDHFDHVRHWVQLLAERYETRHTNGKENKATIKPDKTNVSPICRSSTQASRYLKGSLSYEHNANVRENAYNST